MSSDVANRLATNLAEQPAEVLGEPSWTADQLELQFDLSEPRDLLQFVREVSRPATRRGSLPWNARELAELIGDRFERLNGGRLAPARRLRIASAFAPQHAYPNGQPSRYVMQPRREVSIRPDPSNPSVSRHPWCQLCAAGVAEASALVQQFLRKR
jgi:hypothetical protein